ncbi:6-phosphofructokinase [Streptomyces umbrinus]|uniref:6-phosphofructokinase n=1 Tax=Streptomyces umbrinus TaxID=67370 RepID=UPI003429D8C9
MPRSVVLGLAGAPTVVVEASLRACRDVLAQCCDVQGVTGGPRGLMEGAFTPLGGARLSSVPVAGCQLGSGRHAMTPLGIASIVDQLEASRIDALVLAGGNGTMALLEAVDAESRSRNLGLRTIGIPKTIDNDLLGVDFSPGFGSAARYLALTIPSIARDQLAMSSMEPIRVVETMGRGTGWLAAAGAAGFILEKSELVADLCLIPESSNMPIPEIFDAVEEALSARSRAFIICSEGFPFPSSRDDYRAINHSTLLLGGVARRLARALQAEFGRSARGEVLGTQQRSSHTFASAADCECARLTGEWAGRYVLEGRSGVMAGTRRVGSDPLALAIDPIPLADVASLTKPLPKEFWPVDSQRRHHFIEWLWPIISPGVSG